MKRMNVLIAALAAMIVNAGCIDAAMINKRKHGFCGSGDIVTHNLGPLDYEGVRAERMVKVTITDGESTDVILRADDNILEYVDIKVRDGILTASVDSRLEHLDECTVEVFVPWREGIRSLEAEAAASVVSQAVIRSDKVCLKASAASKIEAVVVARKCECEVEAASKVELEFSDGQLCAEVAGAAKLTAKVDAASVDVTVAGASKAELSGSAVEAGLCAAGAAKISAAELETVDCSATAAGASKVSVNCSGKLDVSAAGLSKVSYTGNCRLGRYECAGASKISKK